MAWGGGGGEERGRSEDRKHGTVVVPTLRFYSLTVIEIEIKLHIFFSED